MAVTVPAVEGMRQAIRERLRSAKVDCKTALVRQILSDIEAATDAGFTYVQIADWLAEKQYLTITGKHLAVIVSQLRKQRKVRRERPKAQLSLFDKLKADKAAEDGKKFKHDPLQTGKELM